MKILRPYVSLDVETTGLDAKENRLLSIGMVADDGRPETKIENMPQAHIGIDLRGVEYKGNDYALELNSKLISYLKGEDGFSKENEDFKDLRVMNSMDAYFDVRKFLIKATDLAQAWDEENGIERPEKVQLLTKNGEKLDIPFMNQHFFDEIKEETDRKWFTNMISHRGMDVGSMYIPDYGRNVSLSVINKELGIAPVSHNALQDAKDNIVAFRSKMGMTY